MLFFLKSTSSRTVHHFHDQDPQDDHCKNIHACGDETCTSLTVWRKSLIFSCSGFTVIGPDGGLAYRVDNYTGRPNLIVLMDGSGNPIFTLCRPKKLRFVDYYWLVYEGEVGKYCNSVRRTSSKNLKPIFTVRKNINIIKQTKVNVLAHVNYYGNSNKRSTYTVEGSYTHRSCKILDDSTRVVGEIKRKEATTGGASFGLEVFHLVVKPGFDSRFAMAIVLLLDQMFT